MMIEKGLGEHTRLGQIVPRDDRARMHEQPL
jgi:hypothetical protein